MTICYYPPTKQEVLVGVTSERNNAILYASSLPIIIAPAIIVLNNILKTTISIGWAIVILSLIQALIKLVKTKNSNEFIGEIKRLSFASLLMWMIPHLATFLEMYTGDIFYGVSKSLTLGGVQ